MLVIQNARIGGFRRVRARLQWSMPSLPELIVFPATSRVSCVCFEEGVTILVCYGWSRVFRVCCLRCVVLGAHPPNPVGLMPLAASGLLERTAFSSATGFSHRNCCSYPTTQRYLLRSFCSPLGLLKVHWVCRICFAECLSGIRGKPEGPVLLAICGLCLASSQGQVSKAEADLGGWKGKGSAVLGLGQ